VKRERSPIKLISSDVLRLLKVARKDPASLVAQWNEASAKLTKAEKNRLVEGMFR
jgi:hypothetical protein